MKIGICFFMESNLGGAATQADDLVTAARRLGHKACLLRFATSPRSKNLWQYDKKKMPAHKLCFNGSGLKIESQRLLTNQNNAEQVIEYLNTFDLLIYVGGCPHITRDFEAQDFHDCYKHLYTDVNCNKVMFFTDPFWQKLYPYAKDVIDNMNLVYAFAEAYRRMVVDSGLHNDVRVCNFGVVDVADRAKKLTHRNSKNTILWPHQWRSWKNPETLLKVAPLLRNGIHAYSNGIEYHKLRRDQRKVFNTAVKYDHIKDESLNPEGKVTIFGVVEREGILDDMSTCRWMLDLTGMSGRTGKPIDKFVGNYQCVNIECMMLGCVNFKYENTVEPYSQIPRDCVIPMPLITEPKELSQFVNRNSGPSRYSEIAERAQKWSLDKFDPEKVFQQCFITPFE